VPSRLLSPTSAPEGRPAGCLPIPRREHPLVPALSRPWPSRSIERCSMGRAAIADVAERRAGQHGLAAHSGLAAPERRRILEPGHAWPIANSPMASSGAYRARKRRLLCPASKVGSGRSASVRSGVLASFNHRRGDSSLQNRSIARLSSAAALPRLPSLSELTPA